MIVEENMELTLKEFLELSVEEFIIDKLSTKELIELAQDNLKRINKLESLKNNNLE